MKQQRPNRLHTHTQMSAGVVGTRVRIKFLYSELRASLSSSEGHLLLMLSWFCPSRASVLRPVGLAPASALQHSLIFQMQ